MTVVVREPVETSSKEFTMYSETVFKGLSMSNGEFTTPVSSENMVDLVLSDPCYDVDMADSVIPLHSEMVYDVMAAWNYNQEVAFLIISEYGAVQDFETTGCTIDVTVPESDWKDLHSLVVDDGYIGAFLLSSYGKDLDSDMTWYVRSHADWPSEFTVFDDGAAIYVGDDGFYGCYAHYATGATAPDIIVITGTPDSHEICKMVEKG